MNRLRKTTLALFVALLLTFPLSVMGAKKVYINGMDMAKYLLTSITLKCVTVKFDAKGNIHIIAPGYNFKPSRTVKAPPVKSRGDKLANRFYLVTFPKPAKVNTGFDVDVMVNGKFVKRIYANSGQIVYDITSSMKKGKNSVVFLAKKRGVKPAQLRGSMKIAIARGYEAKGTYVIKNLIWEVLRSATDTKASYYNKTTVTK